MKITKLLGLAVVLVALTIAINTLAFKQANVTNPVSLTVDTTSAAALAISGGSGTGYTVNIPAAGYASVTFSDKMQPYSDYTFAGVFTLTNNSSQTITLTANQVTTTGGVTIDFLSGGNPLTTQTIAASGNKVVDVKITVPAGFVAGGGTLNAGINADAVISAGGAS